MKDSDYSWIIHHPHRPNAREYITQIFPDFIELSGDRLFGDDPSIVGGIASLNGTVVTIVGNIRGHNIEERLQTNFSMAKPEGYRKIIRLMKQAEKFKRPVICFVDTIGAYPGKEAEERGQANAIANCILHALNLKTPILSVLLGDGGSGGALALCIADQLVALEHSTLSVISPKACANILWKDSMCHQEIADLLKMKPATLFELGVVNKIISEPDAGAHTAPHIMSEILHACLSEEIKRLIKSPTQVLIWKRKRRYRNMGVGFLRFTHAI